MAQHQTQSKFSGRTVRVQAQDGHQPDTQGPSLSRPRQPDPTSPYEGPADHDGAPSPAANLAGSTGGAETEADWTEMAQPHFSEAQSTLGTVDRGDHFPQPEDARTGLTEQKGVPTGRRGGGAEFPTQAGTVRAGMQVLDGYGHPIGIVEAVEGQRLRLSSTDPHDDGVAFLPLSLIDGVEADRVLLAARGDSSFGLPAAAS